MTVSEARDKRVCRICEKPVNHSGPLGWPEEFGRVVFPRPVLILNFGEEFAHEHCLQLLDKEYTDYQI